MSEQMRDEETRPGGGATSARDAAGHAGRGRQVVVLLLRVALVLVVGLAVVEVQAAATYRVSAGSVTFQLRPAWPGGDLIMPLGPAGQLSLHTHRTPVDVIMDYRLPSQTAALLDEGSQQRPRLEGGAREAFGRYLLGRIPWLLLAGAAAGLLVVGHQTRRRRLWGLLGGAVAGLLLGGALALASYATLDRSPAVQYAGLASRVPAVLPLLRDLSSAGDQSDRLTRLEDFLAGLEAVATQLDTPSAGPGRQDVVRLLVVSDIHDNLFGARAAARLAAGGGHPVDGVLLAGDLTDAGTAEEAQLFVRVFGRPGAPVLLVGGNHEDAPAMRVFRRAGYRELRGRVVDLAGVTVLGASDPVASSPRVSSDLPALAASAVWLDALWRVDVPQPSLLLVHDVRQAADTIASARQDGVPLVVAYGNDHVAGVAVDDGVVEVDAGTAGASGYEAIGAVSSSPSPAAEAEPPASSRDAYTFQLIDFSRSDPPRLVAVTTVSYAAGGRTVVTYLPFGR